MQNPTVTLATVNSKVPPIPPPKPKFYQLLQYQHGHGQIAKFGQLSRSVNGGGQLPPPPGDSDTDSGICADSDSQLSPRHINSAGILDNKSKKLQYKLELPIYHEHLTPESAWRVRTNLSTLSNQKCSPEGVQTNCQTSRNGKQYRVRFADQVSSTDGSSLTSSSGWNNSDLIGSSSTNYSDCYLNRFTTGATVTTSATPINNPDQILSTFISSDNSDINSEFSNSHAINDQFDFGYSNHPKAKPEQQYQHQISGCYEQDNNNTALSPPSQSLPRYSMAMTRLRRNDGQWLSPANDPSLRMIRCFHDRSASLPRGMHRQSAASKIRRGSVDFHYPSQDYLSHMQEDEGYLMRSIDNLSITEKDHDEKYLDNGRRLPDLPSNYAAYDGAIQQPIFGRQRRMRRTGANSRSQSAGRISHAFDSKMAKNYINNHVSSFPRSNLPSVRARLVALDHRGLRIILIEKLQPGPFGFYIATGILNQKRGIFISRISLPSLAPVLSVGDQIIYVEDELVKGENLEYVQSLIAGKSSVKIALLPTVGPRA